MKAFSLCSTFLLRIRHVCVQQKEYCHFAKNKRRGPMHLIINWGVHRQRTAEEKLSTDDAVNIYIPIALTYGKWLVQCQSAFLLSLWNNVLI